MIGRVLLFAWIAVGTVAPVAAAKGRYKVGSDGKCYWDAKDDGPNQCTPPLPTEPGPSANRGW